jgi:hypothetical protein
LVCDLQATLRSGENAGDELAHELSLLLEETVATTCKMNALAQVEKIKTRWRRRRV